MKIKRTGLKFATLLSAAALVLTACGGGGTSEEPGTSAPEDSNESDTAGDGGDELDGTITIGAVLPLTGSSATIGMDQERGVALALEEINSSGGVLGKALEVKIEDSEGRAESAIQAAQKLVNVDGVPLIVGAYSSGITIPMQQYLQEQGIVGVNPGSSSALVAENGDMQFSVIGLDNVAGKFAAESLWDAGYKTIGFMAPNNAYGSGLGDNVTEFFEELGGTVNETVLYTEGQTDYRQDVERLKAADPDAYVVTMYGEEGTVVNRQMYELGLNDKPVFHIYTSMDIPDSDPLSVEGHWGMDVGITGSTGGAYAERYQAAYGESFVSAFNGFAYDAVMLTAAAIEKAGSAEPEAIAQAITEVIPYEGVTGEIDLDENGQRITLKYLLADVVDGEIVPR